MLKTSELLKGTRKLIEKRENWTVHVTARNAQGKEVDAYSDEATCFCSLGALGRVAYITSKGQEKEIDKAFYAGLEYLRCAVSQWGVSVYNDTHTHEEVLKMFDDAISCAERDENGK